MYLHHSIANKTRLIVAHPNYYQQHRLLIQFVLNANSEYVRFTDTKLDIATALAQIEASVGTLRPKQKIKYLVLDECDRLKPLALSRLIRDLLSRSGNIKIVILSRVLPNIILQDVDVRNITQIIPIDKGLRLSDTTTTYPKPHLEVHAFGRGRAFVDGKEILRWPGQLARNLFFFMVDNPIVTRNVIFKTFWPDTADSGATNVFHVTKGSIHDVLGFELLKYGGPYYRLTDDIELTYDVADFHDLSQNGMQERDEDQLMMAHTLFNGTFLQDTEEKLWITTRRDELKLLYSETMNTLAQLKEDAGELDMALGISIRILAMNLGRDDVTRRVMEMYLKRNQPCDALKIYQIVLEYMRQNKVPTNNFLDDLRHDAEVGCDQ